MMKDNNQISNYGTQRENIKEKPVLLFDHWNSVIIFIGI